VRIDLVPTPMIVDTTSPILRKSSAYFLRTALRLIGALPWSATIDW
jgi:hypothetical protein